MSKLKDVNGFSFNVDTQEPGFAKGSSVYFMAMVNGITFLKRQVAALINQGDTSPAIIRQANSVMLLSSAINGHMQLINAKPGDPLLLAQFIKSIKNRDLGEKQLIYLSIRAISEDLESQLSAIDEVKEALLKDPSLADLEAELEKALANEASNSSVDGLDLAVEKLEALIPASPATPDSKPSTAPLEADEAHRDPVTLDLGDREDF